jgi:general secretion pathway protein A
MFLEYYGLREQPFGVTPDPRFLYFGEAHREALASLFYGIESGCGPCFFFRPSADRGKCSVTY